MATDNDLPAGPDEASSLVAREHADLMRQQGGDTTISPHGLEDPDLRPGDYQDAPYRYDQWNGVVAPDRNGGMRDFGPDDNVTPDDPF